MRLEAKLEAIAEFEDKILPCVVDQAAKGTMDELRPQLEKRCLYRTITLGGNQNLNGDK